MLFRILTSFYQIFILSCLFRLLKEIEVLLIYHGILNFGLLTASLHVRKTTDFPLASSSRFSRKEYSYAKNDESWKRQVPITVFVSAKIL